jgi:TIR domain
MRQSRPRAEAALRHRKRVALFLSLSLPTLLLLYAFRVVRLESGQRELAVPIGLWRKPDCCQGFDDVTCLRTRLNLTDGAIRKCWGDESVNSVRFGLVVSFWGAALSCGALIGLLLLRERPTVALDRQSEPPGIQPQSYHLFLSYAAKDRDFARRLVDDLNGQGIKVWWAEQEVGAGEPIRRRIEQGLKASDRFAVVLSPESVQSSWVNEEIDSAFVMEADFKKTGRRESFLIPILYRDCEMPLFLRTLKYANFIASYEQGLKELLRQLVPQREQDSSFIVSSKIPTSLLPDASIFISHAPSDDEVIAELRRNLEAFQIPVWVDTRKSRGGSRLPPEIEAAIEQARHCIVVLSPSTVNWPWVRREITKALAVEQSRQTAGYRVIPLLLPGITRQALEFWFNEEPVTQPIEVGPGGLSVALPALLAALGEHWPTDSQHI